MNEPSVHKTPDDGEEAKRPTFAMTPSPVLFDTSLGPWALRLYAVLDWRAGRKGYCRVGIKQLAADLGTSERTTRRAVSELREAGWVQIKETGRTHDYTVVNPSRPQKKKRKEPSPATYGNRDRPHMAAAQNHNSSNQNNSAPVAAEAPAQPPPAASVVGDQDKVKALQSALPEHLRPNRTAAVESLLDAAVINGWTPEALGRRISEELNANQGPGATVSRLRAIAHEPPPKPKPKKPPWCGTCDQRTRLLEEGTLTRRCPDCHPYEVGEETA